MAQRDPHLGHTILAGVVCALVGFTSSFAVVLTGLSAVGASQRQATSGLLVLCLTMGAGCIAFSVLRRQPITMAWSTPGAAMLAGASMPSGGFATGVGAFVLCGLLLALTGLIRPLNDLMTRVPRPLASAMLAGVLLPLCTAPVRAVVHDPLRIAPVVGAWPLARALAPRWAVPVAVLAAGAVIVASGSTPVLDSAAVEPALVGVRPTLDVPACIAIALPLYLVTMTSQNLPGIGVLASLGYRLEPRGPLLYTGLASAVGALFGGHAINLAAISAALAAGPEVHPDRGRRWIAGVACGVTYILFGLGSGAVIAVARSAPAGLLATIAGVALLGTFAVSPTAALTDDGWREAGAVAIVVGACGISVAGIGSAFWALVAGGVMAWVARPRAAS